MLNDYDILTIAIGSFFTLVLYIGYWRTKSAQLINYIPSAWTSLGIFFTFFSIYKGLYGLDFSAVDNRAVQVLIAKISPAFSTSMIGIAGALITSLINKFTIAAGDKSDDDKLRAYTHKTPEVILHDIDKTTRALSITLSDIANKEEAYQDRMIECFKEALINFQEKADNQAELQEKRWKAKMETLVDSAKLAINEIKSSNNKLIENFITTTNERIDALTKSLTEESESREAELKSFMKEHHELLSGNISDYERFNEEFLVKLTHLFNEEIAKSINSFAEEQFSSSAAIIEDIHTRMARSLEDITSKIEESLSQAADKITNTTKQMLISHDEELLSAVGNTLENNRKQLQCVIEASVSNIESLASVFELRYNQITDVLGAHFNLISTKSMQMTEDYTQNTSKIMEKVNTSLDEIQKEIEKSANRAGSNITSLEQTLKENIEGVKNIMVTYHKEIALLYKNLLSGISKDIQKTVNMEALTNLTRKYSEELQVGLNILKVNVDTITGSLSNVTNCLKDNTDDYLNVSGNISELNTTLTKIIETLRIQTDILRELEHKG